MDGGMDPTVLRVVVEEIIRNMLVAGVGIEITQTDDGKIRISQGPKIIYSHVG